MNLRHRLELVRLQLLIRLLELQQFQAQVLLNLPLKSLPADELVLQPAFLVEIQMPYQLMHELGMVRSNYSATEDLGGGNKV